jgi:hypothetical protein
MSLLLFNWFGYRVVSALLENKADIQLESAIALNGYADTDLIKLTVPLNLPYQVTNHEFKSIKGEITINGKIYTYVKRQIINDSMTLLCIPNLAKTKLTEARHNYFSNIADADQNTQAKSKQSSVLKSVVLDAELSALRLPQNSSISITSIAPWHAESMIDTKVCQLPSEPPESILFS